MGASVSGSERRIVLIGKAGDGKSSAGNTILRKQTFPVKSLPTSETSTSESKDGVVKGRKLTVVDTPGIFDTDRDEEALRSEIIESVVECAPGVDAMVIVLKVGRHTEQEMKIIDKIVEYCGEETFERAVVLFTHGEQLEDQTIEEFVHKSPKLEEPVNKCGGRCHVIDNKYWNARRRGYRSNRVQIKNLLETIDKMAIENSSYTNELFQMVEEEIQKEIENMREDSLSPEVRRERAKKNVVEKLLIRLAGVTTGTLIGAFLGIGAALASVVAILNPTISSSGIAAGVILGVAGLAGAIGGGVTGYRAADEADSVLDAMKIAAKANYDNMEKVL